MPNEPGDSACFGYYQWFRSSRRDPTTEKRWQSRCPTRVPQSTITAAKCSAFVVSDEQTTLITVVPTHTPYLTTDILCLQIYAARQMGLPIFVFRFIWLVIIVRCFGSWCVGLHLTRSITQLLLCPQKSTLPNSTYKSLWSPPNPIHNNNSRIKTALTHGQCYSCSVYFLFLPLLCAQRPVPQKSSNLYIVLDQ